MYKPDFFWHITEILKIAVTGGLLGWLFYNHILGIVLTVMMVTVLMWKHDKEVYVRQQKSKVKEEFKNLIVFISGNLNAGYSLENAFSIAVSDMDRGRGDNKADYIIEPEIKRVVNGIKCNQNIEDLLHEFGKKTDLEDILEFSNLISLTKKYGGNMAWLIRQTAGNISQKQLVELEIMTTIAAKNLEGKIMLIMPMAIMFYMKLTNQEYIEILYEQLFGRIVMSICMIVLAFMWIWIGKITRIEV